MRSRHYYPSFSPHACLSALRAFEGINSCWVPIYYTPGSRETIIIVDKMPCLRAYAPSGIRTPNLLIASPEREPLHHSAPNNIVTGYTMWPLRSLGGCYEVHMTVTGCERLLQGLRGCYGVYVAVAGYTWLIWGLLSKQKRVNMFTL